MTGERARPEFERGQTLGQLLRWIMVHGIGRERPNQVWTQEALAAHLGVDDSQIRRWLRTDAISPSNIQGLIYRLLGDPPTWPELAEELKAARHRKRAAAASPALAHNLPPPNPDFVGREQVLSEVRRLLSMEGTAAITQTRAITGLGGVGKTQTALAYAWRHRADYRLIWWIKAEQPATLAADYTGMAASLGLDPATPEQSKLIIAVRAWLEERADWLLLFDNVEDPILLREHLPRQARGHVLLTSRRTDWRGIARPLPLDILPIEEALELLAGGAALVGRERVEVEALARELGFLPLALVQARAFLDGTGNDPAAYRHHLAERRAGLLACGRPSPDYPLPVGLTWQVSVEAAAREEQGARPLLELLAFFSPDAIPRSLLAADPDVLPESLRRSTGTWTAGTWSLLPKSKTGPEILPEPLRDPLDCDRAISALARYSLVRTGAGMLTVHRLVQAVTRDRLTADQAANYASCAVRLVQAAWPGNAWYNPDLWPAIARVLPHALATTEAAEAYGVSLEAVASVLHGAGTYLHARGVHIEAESLLARAVAIGETALPPQHPDVAGWLNCLALLYKDMGRYADAEPIYKRAIAVGEATHGSEHPDFAIWLSNLADLYEMTGRYLEAESLCRRAAVIAERTVGQEHPIFAVRLKSLANLYRDSGRYPEAELLYGRAIEIFERALGPRHPRLGVALHSRARLLVATGRQKQARSELQRALDILEAEFGPDHPWAVDARSELARLQVKGGDGRSSREQAHTEADA